jgi:N-hydroxyarylamine O-acetyltransferase
MPAEIDLAAYCARIGYDGALAPTRAVLDALHLAHATAIPFENVDVVLGRPIRLELADLQSKLVRAGRGGYCFEQNTLFAAALDTIGFRVTRLGARVRIGANAVRPRTHMLLAVDIDDEAIIADVGFGADGLLLPVRLHAAQPTRQSRWTYRIVAEDTTVHVLQALRDGTSRDLYAFTLEPQYAVDFELANWYTSTHPQSRFVQVLTAQRLAIDKRLALRDLELTEDDGSTIRTRVLADAGEQRRALVDIFAINLPDDLELPNRQARQ